MAKTTTKSATAKRRNHTAKSSKSAVELPKHVPTVVPDKNVLVSNYKLPSVWSLSRSALQLLWRHKIVFLGISGIYAALSLIFVQAFSGSLNISALQALIADGSSRLTNGIVTYQWLLSGSNVQGGILTAVYETILIVTTSLAVIWALRQATTEQELTIRKAYYRGMYPLIPVLLVAIFGIIQLLPGLLGIGAYNVIISLGVAPLWFQKLIWLLPALSLTILSIYMVIPTIISLYIATLPNVEPLAAIKTGRDVVKHRRWTVLRKLLFVPIALFLAIVIIFVPILLILPIIAPWVLFIISVLIVPIIHAYLYTLYRELLR